MTNEAAELTDPEQIERDGLVPGMFRCAKCGFALHQMNLNAQDGTVTARDAPGDKCPNDGSPMWRVTWKERCLEAEDRAFQEIEARTTDAATIARLREDVTASVGEKLWNVWEQADDNHRGYSDMGDRESDIRFLSLGLTGEAGELANFIKKRWRDGEAHTDAIQKEIADVCAYAFMLANVMGLSPGTLLDIMAEKQRVFVEKMRARAALAPAKEGE